ncbi:MAG TPA: hypothetical protein VJ717_05260 [Gemmatimonadaceae bacterium]|nr:hypothetical protein [Gemmatimonadaceae bacterium]
MPRLLLATFVVVTQAVQPQAADLPTRAGQAWFGADWGKAAELYATLAKETPNVALPHFRLAAALIALRRHAEARPHLETADRLGFPRPQIAFRLALIHAALGRPDSAFAELKRATDAGLPAIPPGPSTDADLARLKTDPRYASFASAMDRNARPCAHDPRYAEFDFWLGKWEVRPRGQPAAPAATNDITKIHDGCVVLESYTAPGYTGQSFNIYDRTRSQWNQTWVDKAGGLHVYWGGIKDGNMLYEGEMPDPIAPSKRLRTRLTFFRIAADTVRQFSESTRDDGKTWTVNYDLIYTKPR